MRKRSQFQGTRRRAGRRAWAGLLLLALWGAAGPAVAYGPGTHLREAATYRERLREGVAPEAAEGDLALLEDEAYWPLFQMGAIFPDVGRQVEGMGFDAHRLDLHRALLEATADGADPGLRAFVLGAAQHSMSDVGAQVFLVPWMTAATDIGVVDVLVGQFDGPGGENEFFVESVCDLYEGDLHAVVELYFGLDGPTGDALAPVLSAYYEAAEAVLGDQPLTPETFAAGVRAFLDEVGDVVGGLGPELAHRLVDDLQSSPPSEFFDLLTGAGGAFLGLGNVALGPDDLDRLALERLLAHPFVADRGLYGEYGAWFGELGPAFLRDTFDTGIVLTDWRTWHGPPLLAASVQSLAWSLPETHAPEPDVLVWALGWEGPEGDAITAVDAGALPSEVTLAVELFAATTRSVAVVAEVRGDRPGPAVADDPTLATASVEVPGLPVTGGPPQRAEVRVAFDPEAGVGEVDGFYAVLRVEGSEKPFLTTLADAWLTTEAADLTLPGWDAVFGGAPGWAPTLPLANSGAVGEDAWLDVRVRNRRYPREGVAGVALSVEEEASGTVAALESSAVGRVLWGPAAEGTYRVWAESAAEATLPPPSEWVTAGPGDVAVVTLAVDPEPRVAHAGFTTNRARARGRVDDLRFRATQPFEAAVAGTDAPPEVGWQALGGRVIDLPLEPERADGEAVYLFARAAAENELPVGPVGVSAPLVVDGSPPSAPVLAVAPVWASGAERLDGTLSADDPHSGVVGFRVSVEDTGGNELLEVAIPDASPAALHLERGDWLGRVGAVVLVPVALNGAGLEAVGEARAVTVLPASAGDDVEPAEPVADAGEDEAMEGGDAGEVTRDGAGPEGGEAAGGGEAGCGCGAAGGEAPAAWWLAGLLVAAGVSSAGGWRAGGRGRWPRRRRSRRRRRRAGGRRLRPRARRSLRRG